MSLIFFFNKAYLLNDLIIGNLLNNLLIMLKSCDVRS